MRTISASRGLGPAYDLIAVWREDTVEKRQWHMLTHMINASCAACVRHRHGDSLKYSRHRRWGFRTRTTVMNYATSMWRNCHGDV